MRKHQEQGRMEGIAWEFQLYTVTVTKSSYTKNPEPDNLFLCHLRSFMSVWKTGELDAKIEELLPRDCGKPIDSSNHFLTSLAKVRGGTTPSMFDKPWAATLRSRSLLTGDFFVLACGATVLSEDFLLTSASCFLSLRGPDDFLVRVGDYNINIRSPSTEA
ncbi:hypothetical protein Pcinc_004146 [Petrolisthes cinctipes]|uniref:Peptidase S1 domain-containing protein n=1 Tax=Petrolisthes cinctipes TaxID=88211 RepID=A0AAE1GM22_PETCI|nr:hypothetical protein Pcinc_004146 [Petrolisthes cinctipes]